MGLKTTGWFLRCGFVVALLLAAIPARAASVTFYLDQSNALPGGSLYLSVMLTENATGGVDFLVQTLDPLNGIAGSNFGIQKFGYGFIDGSWGEVGGLSKSWRTMRNRNMSSFGKFDGQLLGTGKSRTDSLSFTVAGVSLDDFDSYFAAHVAGFESCDAVSSSGKKNKRASKNCITSAFFAGDVMQLPPPNPGASPVPVPAAVWLFGSGLLGLIGFARRRGAGGRR